jgi:hypothetical protein
MTNVSGLHDLEVMGEEPPRNGSDFWNPTSTILVMISEFPPENSLTPAALGTLVSTIYQPACGSGGVSPPNYCGRTRSYAARGLERARDFLQTNQTACQNLA